MVDSTLLGFWASTILTCIIGVILLIEKHIQSGSILIFLGFTIGSFASLISWKIKGINVVSPITSLIALLSSIVLLAYFIVSSPC
jgi:hypothetical protein